MPGVGEEARRQNDYEILFRRSDFFLTPKSLLSGLIERLGDRDASSLVARATALYLLSGVV